MINTFTKTGACFVKVLVFLYILSPTVHLIPSVNFFFGLSLPILCFFCFNHLPPSYFNTGFRYCSHHLGLSISTVGDWGIILPTWEQISNWYCYFRTAFHCRPPLQYTQLKERLEGKSDTLFLFFLFLVVHFYPFIGLKNKNQFSMWDRGVNEYIDTEIYLYCIYV